MPRIYFSPHFEKHVATAPAEVAGATVAEALSAAFVIYPHLKGYVVDDQGSVRKHVMIFVDDRYLTDRQSLSDPLSPGSEIHVMQALSGG